MLIGMDKGRRNEPWSTDHEFTGKWGRGRQVPVENATRRCPVFAELRGHWLTWADRRENLEIPCSEAGLATGRVGGASQLVLGAVFKTVVSCVNRRTGGFDSHAPPFPVLRVLFGRSHPGLWFEGQKLVKISRQAGRHTLGAR